MCRSQGGCAYHDQVVRCGIQSSKVAGFFQYLESPTGLVLLFSAAIVLPSNPRSSTVARSPDIGLRSHQHFPVKSSESPKSVRSRSHQLWKLRRSPTCTMITIATLGIVPFSGWSFLTLSNVRLTGLLGRALPCRCNGLFGANNKTDLFNGRNWDGSITFVWLQFLLSDNMTQTISYLYFYAATQADKLDRKGKMYDINMYDPTLKPSAGKPKVEKGKMPCSRVTDNLTGRIHKAIKGLRQLRADGVSALLVNL